MIQTVVKSALLFFVFFGASCGGGAGRTGRSIDINLPHDDPSSYPDNPILTVPPTTACPYKAVGGCPAERDAGVTGGDAGDAPVFDSSTTDRGTDEGSSSDTPDADPDLSNEASEGLAD